MLRESRKATSLIIPDEIEHWPGKAPPTKLSHELSKAEKNGRWRVNKARQLALQKAVNEKVEEDRVKRYTKELEREKRKAEENLQSDAKRRRILKEVLKRAADDAEKQVEEHALAENTKKLDEMIKKKQLYDAAIVASLLKQNEGLTEEEALEEVQQRKKKEEDRLEKQRIEMNKQLKAAGRPEILTPAPMDLDAIMAATEEKMEAARKSDRKRTELEAIRKLERMIALQEKQARRKAGERAHEAARMVQQAQAEEAERIRQAKGAADTLAACRALQARWERLIEEFHSHPHGTPAQVQAAQSLITLNNSALTTEADRVAWMEWQQGQTSRQIRNHSVVLEAARSIVMRDREAQAKRIQMAAARNQKSVAKSPTSPVELPPTPSTPKTIDIALQSVIDEFDSWDLDLQRAQLASLETHMRESREALNTRAASANMSPLEYAKSEGFPDVEAFLAAQREMVARDQRPVPDADEIRNEVEANAAHLAAYKGDMRSAIRTGLGVRAGHGNYANIDQFAIAQGFRNASVWIEEKLAGKQITLEDIPSRKPLSEMSEEEYTADRERWRVWCGRLNDAANWRARIVLLPGPPNYTRPTRQYDEHGSRWTCEV